MLLSQSIAQTFVPIGQKDKIDFLSGSKRREMHQ